MTSTATRTFRVTVIIAEHGVRETFTVKREDEWKARSAAGLLFTQKEYAEHGCCPTSGAFVEYVVEEVAA